MRNARKLFRKAARLSAALLLGTALTGAAGISSYAADGASLDLNQTGSIQVTLYSDETDSAVTDGVITIYQVASLYLDDGNMAYASTDAFQDCEADLDVNDASLAATLAAYVEEYSITGTAESVGTDGKVSFDGLELGLYLVMQTTQSTGYYTIEPFAVTVPIENGGAWDYSVDASPKCEIYVEPETPQETTETTAVTETTETSTEATVSTTTTLPQTGQLNWPIPVLAVSGLTSLFLGCFLLKSDKKREVHAA